jgi:hypothetical protein
MCAGSQGKWYAMWAIIGFLLGGVTAVVLSVYYYRKAVGVKPTDRLGSKRFHDNHDGGFVSIAI